MKKINWGMIGCGDVTEVKSGPAFKKVPQSNLVAVMRRDAAKAQGYAQRHGVAKWYSNAAELIADPEVNAIYIATPPDAHETYATAAIHAGKRVYIEKPMALNYAASQRIALLAADKKVPVVVAHYRRAQPLFATIKSLLNEGAIGKVLMARLSFFAPPLTAAQLATNHHAWRVNPAIAGGGLFHDLAPHQLDLMYYFFGVVKKATGMATNQCGAYIADDVVMGNILFHNDIVFTGCWNFNAPFNEDSCEIIGTTGAMRFSVFANNGLIVTAKDGSTQTMQFDALQHVQQPMIEKVVQYFLDPTRANPCSAWDGVAVMQLMEAFTEK